MSKNLSGKYYEEVKVYKKKLVRGIKIFLKKKKKKCDNIVLNVTKIFQKIKSKSLLSIKKYYRMGKSGLL